MHKLNLKINKLITSAETEGTDESVPCAKPLKNKAWNASLFSNDAL